MNHAIKMISVTCLAGGLLTGCSNQSLREVFLVRQNELAALNTATLGRTPRDEILGRFGAPQEIDQRWFEGRESDVFFYVDEVQDEDSGLLNARILACEFTKGALTGYLFQELGTGVGGGYDEKARGKLVKGATTRSQVESALGQPQGRSLMPTSLNLAAAEGRIGGAPTAVDTVPAGANEVWFYVVQGYDDSLDKPKQRSLLVFFDDKGLYLGSSAFRQLVVKSS